MCRILDAEEIEWLLQTSARPDYDRLLRGGMSVVVYLGLYAGLHNSEMRFLPWQHIDWKKRILKIGNYQLRTPERPMNKRAKRETIDYRVKTGHARRLDIKQRR